MSIDNCFECEESPTVEKYNGEWYCKDCEDYILECYDNGLDEARERAENSRHE